LYFSPNGGCSDAIIKQIDEAKSTILVQAYSFTSTPIAKALLEAHKRGAKVEVILDKSQRKASYTSASFLANSRIPTFIDDVHAIAHNKVMIIDGKIVITGSFNFTKAAESKNAENLLILESPELAKIYTENWNRHRDHSEPYEPRD
jgi:phosphatidylserine/phosphatidylglycerophosphate/cardiolipin synthase-like enzyme